MIQRYGIRQARLFLMLAVLTALLVEGTGVAQTQVGRPRVASERPSMIDAFLNKPVNSTNELVATLQKSRELRQRYARHFNLPERRVVDAFRTLLVVDHLKRDRVVTTYCITPGGRIYHLRRTFLKGTKVWALRDGTPVLRWACANPLTKRLPMTLTSRQPKLSPPPEEAGIRPRVTETTPMPQIPELVAAVEVPPQEPISVNVEALAAEPVTGSGVAISGGISIAGKIPTYPLTTFVLPWIGVIHHHPGKVTPPVPEPTSLALFGLTLPLLLGARRHKALGETLPTFDSTGRKESRVPSC